MGLFKKKGGKSGLGKFIDKNFVHTRVPSQSGGTAVPGGMSREKAEQYRIEAEHRQNIEKKTTDSGELMIAVTSTLGDSRPPHQQSKKSKDKQHRKHKRDKFFAHVGKAAKKAVSKKGAVGKMFTKTGVFGKDGVLAGKDGVLEKAFSKDGVLDKAFSPIVDLEGKLAGGAGDLAGGIGGFAKTMSNPLFLIGAGVVAVVVIPRIMGPR